MLTSQKFLGMTVMMLVLFFIVQFPQIMKEAGNEYDVNEYAVDPEIGRASCRERV